jgi:hypothetical protein
MFWFVAGPVVRKPEGLARLRSLRSPDLVAPGRGFSVSVGFGRPPLYLLIRIKA